MQSIEEIYRMYASTVYKYLLVLSKDADIAEELTGETFYQAIKGIQKFDYSCKLSTWLCAIAKNQYYSYRRKHKETIELDTVGLAVKSAEETVLENENKVVILKKLHECPEPYREILYLRLFGELSFREIGEVFGKTENWARVSYYRGKEKVKQLMEVEINEE